MKTPITVITGYLGSGKTTLLRHIIDNVDRKIAILMNEFGQIGIDTQVIKGKAVDMMELKGGCVCCSMTGEFEAAIREIKDKINPELIIVETTGVAEPDALVGDIAENLEGVRLDAVITVVDADSMLKFPSLGYTGRIQIEMGDVILLNKIDLVSDDQLSIIEGVINSINPTAIVYKTQNSMIDIDLIFDLKIEKSVGKILKGTKTHKHRTDELNLGSFAYESQDKMSKSMLEQALSDVPKDIVRAKGFVITDEGTFLLNFVFGRLDLEPFEAKNNQLVFIGKNAEKHREGVLEKLKECEFRE